MSVRCFQWCHEIKGGKTGSGDVNISCCHLTRVESRLFPGLNGFFSLWERGMGGLHTGKSGVLAFIGEHLLLLKSAGMLRNCLVNMFDNYLEP